MAIFSGLATAVATVLVGVGFNPVTALVIGIGAGNLARSLALSLVLNALSPKASIPKMQLRATINQATGPRTKMFGQGLLGGTRAFWEVSGNKLYQIIVINHGQVDDIISFWLDGRPVEVDQNGVVAGELYDENVSLAWHDGAGEGGDYPFVKAAFPTIWTDAHKLQGQATIAAVFQAPSAEAFNRAFPKGAQTDVQAEIYGSFAYDPRLILNAYSDNAGLCIAEYLADADGWNIPREKFDEYLCNAFYDLCDEPVVRRAGGTRKRYRLWGAVDLTANPKSELARMLTTCNAQVYQTAEGKIAFMGGTYQAPDVTITDRDILKFNLVDGTDKLDAFNVVKGVYTSRDHAYQDTEAQIWENETALLTQPERVHDFIADMVPDHGQMRQLMKLEINRKNRPFSLSITTNLVGIKARFPKGIGYHVIRVTSEEEDFDEVCEVVSHETFAESDENGVLQFRCQIELVGIDPAWNDWDPVTEEGVAPIAPDELDVEAVPVPTITLLQQFTAGSGQGVRVEVADISRPDLVFTAQIRVSPSGAWGGMVETDLQAESVGRSVGQTYDVRVKFNGGSYSATSSITLV